jgi:16S rRNA (adenine1518-N6/adenine1519-N6)-dimethyltransferase
VNRRAREQRQRRASAPRVTRPKKRFGQHFLVSPAVLRGILRLAELTPEDTVLEIGAGTGTLTAALAAKVRQVLAVEVDRDLIPPLRRRFAGQPHVRIIHADALRFDFAQLTAPCKVVANLPYGTATAILMRLLAQRRRISLAVVMLQREVAARLCATPGTKAYGSLTLTAQWYATVYKGFQVPPSAFSPAPKVMSSVVKIIPHAQPPLAVRDEALLFRLIRAAFAQRRKTLLNALAAALRPQVEPAVLAQTLRAAGLDGRRRGETLTLAEFARLADALSVAVTASGRRLSEPAIEGEDVAPEHLDDGGGWHRQEDAEKAEELSPDEHGQ